MTTSIAQAAPRRNTVQTDRTGLNVPSVKSPPVEVAGQQWMGGSGGLLSRETIRAADSLRLALDRHRQARVANFATPVMTSEVVS